VKSVKIISDIAIMEVFEDQTSTRVGLTKLGQVIEPVINDNLDLLAGSHRILISTKNKLSNVRFPVSPFSERVEMDIESNGFEARP